LKDIVIDFEPNYWQHHLDEKTPHSGVWVCHRGLGKTTLVANWIVKRVIQSKVKLAKGLYVAPLRTQARSVAWPIFKSYIKSIPGAKCNENEMRIDIPPDKTVWLLGSDTPDSIRGHHPVAIGMDEVGQMRPSTWHEVLIPTTWRHNAGVIAIGTPKGRNLFWDMYNFAKSEIAEGNTKWFVDVIKASQSGLLTPEQQSAAKKAMGDAMYSQEFECEFMATILGAYYSDALNNLDSTGRIGDYPYDPKYPVETGWVQGYYLLLVV